MEDVPLKCAYQLIADEEGFSIVQAIGKQNNMAVDVTE